MLYYALSYHSNTEAVEARNVATGAWGAISWGAKIYFAPHPQKTFT